MGRRRDAGDVGQTTGTRGDSVRNAERRLDAIRDALDYEHRPDHRRFWLFLSLVTATVRGIISDNLVTDPRGFRAINDEDFCAWILRHGAHPDVLDFPARSRAVRHGLRL